MTHRLPSFNSEAGIPLVPLFYVTKRHLDPVYMECGTPV